MNERATISGMRHLPVLLAVGLALLAACADPLPPGERPIKTVDTFRVASPVTDGVRNLPARLVASQRVELSFRVPGKLAEIRVREGVLVTAGEILAVLEQSEFETALKDREAAFQNASRDYERARVLIVEEAMSKQDYDEVVAEYRIARAELEQARVDLEYTYLRAPFDGEVSTRSVENFEEVTAGEQIFYITDTSRLDVKFAIPESLMVMLRSATDKPSDDAVRVSLRLPDRPDVAYPMEFKEFAQRPDSETKTYEVTYQVEQLSDGLLLPGMTATAEVELFDFVPGNFRVPARTVYGDIYMQPRVWVLDENELRVSSRSVSVGRKAGSSIAITAGVEAGETLVTSHVAFLREGEQVALSGEPVVP